MRDEAHEWTDEQIAALIKRIRLTYRSAQIDVQGKLYQFIHKFKRDEAKFREKLEKGEITEATYRDWLAGQVFQGKRWRTMLATLTDTLTRADELVAQLVNDATPEAFAHNANWAAYQIEKGGNINVGFELTDRATVARLLRDVPDLLPRYKIDIPEDKRWNRKAITHQINLGIIEGEPLDTIAKRLQRVTSMDFNAARTNARTAMTGAQNAGRMETYRKAEELGIEGQKEWLATLDSHTRHAHAMLDGQKRPRDAPFDSELGPIMYPGDPDARPANVYNCRCTLIYSIAKYPSKNAKRRPNLQEYGDAIPQKPIKDMTYAEWAGWKQEMKNAEKT